MKQIITLAALMFCFASASFAQAEKTLIKSLATETASTAVLELPGEVAVSNWDKDYIHITATINVTNSSEEILKKLIAVGRYDITSVTENGQITINMSKVAHQVIIKGISLDENIKYEVQLPYGVQAVVKTQAPVTANQAM